jgi:hypothetical protein
MHIINIYSKTKSEKIMLDSINTELGYYICDEKIFTSKIEACIHGTKTQKPVQWIFNDAVFSRFDWSAEPDETLDELYDRRAREIRERYDYVIVSYSGGADSHNLLTSFFRQDLLVDEIIVNIFEKANRLYVPNGAVKDSWNYGAEYSLQIYPRLEEIRNRCPNTKITVVDMSDTVFDTLNTAGDESWIMDKRETLNVSGLTRYNYVWFKEVKKNFDKNKKIVLVLGEGKPMTYISNGKMFITFIDNIANVITAQEHLNDHPNAKAELFYWHPSSTKMMAKQAHTTKKYLLANPAMRQIWTPKTKLEFAENSRKYYHSILRNIIYTTWNESWYQSDKGKSGWYDDIDEWFHRLYKDTREYAIWQAGIKYVETHARDYVNRDKHGVATGLRAFDKIYLISDLNAYVSAESVGAQILSA